VQHEAIQAAAFLALIVVPGAGLVAALAPRAGWGTRIAIGMPAGVVLLCAVHAAACAAGFHAAAPWAAWGMAVLGCAALAHRRHADGRPEDRISWAIVGGACCMGATWVLAARHWPMLDSLPPGGSGLDDTAYHAACAAQFKASFPAPDPTAEGFRQQAHFLLHLLVGALSAACGEAPYELLLRAVPLGLAAMLGFQLTLAARSAGIRGTWSVAVSLATVVGGNAGILAAPFLGARTVLNDFPQPTPILLWKLPGLALALACMLPSIALMRRGAFMERNGTTSAGWLVLAAASCAGMCLAKPVAPVVLLCGIALLNAVSLLRTRAPHRETIAFAAMLTACFVGAAALTYDADAYGYGTIEPQPLRSAAATFHVDTGRAGWPLMLAGAVLLWMPLSWASIVGAWRSVRSGPLEAALLVGAGAALAGLALFAALFTPMGAEFQFALAGKFLGDAAGAIILAASAQQAFAARPRRTALVAAAACAVLAAPATMKAWLLLRRPERPTAAGAPLTADLVAAMRWLRDGSQATETVLLSNQEGTNGMLSASECIALSERQAYLACVRYSPGAYVPLWQGAPPPLQARIDEANAVFRAEPGAATTLAARSRVRWAVLDRARGERFDENALRAELGEPAFANARVAIWRIQPPAVGEQEPRRQ